MEQPEIPKQIKQQYEYYVARQKSARKKLIVSIAGIVLIIIGIVFLLNSSIFKIKKIEVTSSNDKNFEFINQQDYIEGLTISAHGNNYFRTNPASIEDDLSKISPFSETLKITKKFPNKVKLEIEIREPFLIISNTEKCVLLDEYGYVLDVYSSDDENNEDAPLLVDCTEMVLKYMVPVLEFENDKAEYPVGMKSTFYQVGDLYKIITVLNDFNYIPQIIKYEGETYEIYLTDSQHIVFATNKDIDEQLKRFILTIGQIESEKLTFKKLDVRYEKPVMSN